MLYQPYSSTESICHHVSNCVCIHTEEIFSKLLQSGGTNRPGWSRNRKKKHIAAYHIAINEVVCSEYGINPSMSTRISKAQYSKLE